MEEPLASMIDVVSCCSSEEGNQMMKNSFTNKPVICKENVIKNCKHPLYSFLHKKNMILEVPRKF